MSSYQEIINNWKLAIESQGFTQEQVEKQLDTISRKYQTLKDQLSGIIMSAGNGGLTETIKTILDDLRMVLRLLNSISSSFYSGAISIGEFVLALYAGKKVMKYVESASNSLAMSLGLNLKNGANSATTSVTTLGTATRRTDSILKTAFKSNAMGLAIFAIGEAISYLVEQYDKAHNAAEIALEDATKEYAANAELYDVTSKRAEFAETLANSYILLKKKVDDTTLSEEMQAKAQKDLEFTEKNLASVIGQSAMDRIKSSQDTEAQMNSEMSTFHATNDGKLKALKQWMIAQQSAALDQWTNYDNQIKMYEADCEAYINGAELKMKTDDMYLKAKALFYEQLADMEDNSVKMYRRERDKADEAFWDGVKNGNLTVREQAQLRDKVSYYNKQIENAEKSRRGYKWNAQYFGLGGNLEELQNLREKVGQTINSAALSSLSKDDIKASFDKTRTDTLGGDTAYPEEPKKSKGSKSGNSYHHPEYNDPAITGYEGKHKSINQQYTDEISSLKKYAEKYGTSEEITMKIDDLYKKQQEENSRATKEYIDHIVQSGNDLYSSRLTTVTTQDLDSFINAIAGQESGGDYGAVNSSSGATGKYQIMPDNWPSWASEAGLSSDAPMTPNNQEIVARHKLSEYYNAYGADGAAVAWYAGAGNAERWVNGSPTDVWGRSWEASQDGAPSIAEYVREVASRNTGTVGYSQTLADLGVNEDDWKNANIQDKQTIISNLMKQDGIKDNEQTLKYLDEVNGTLLKGLEKIQGLQQEAITIQENKDKDLYSNSKAEVEQRKLEVSQRNTSQSYSLGLSIRDIDEQRMKLDELKVSYEALNDILPRFTKGTKTYKELLQETQKAQLEWNKQQKAVVESMFNIRSAMNEHEYKMKDMTGDNGGIRKATAELEKDMKDLANLQIKKQKEWYSLNKEEQWKLDEEIKEKADKVKEAMDKYHDTIMSGLESVAEQFFIDNKSLSDIFHDMWTDLGRDAWKMLFGQKVDNPSILGQIIGLGMPNQEEAKRDAATAMMSENNDALAMNTNGITSLNEAIERLIAVMNGTYHDPFSQSTTNWGSQTVGQSLDSFARFNNPSLSNEQRYSFDRFGATGSSYRVNSTRNSDYTFSMASIKSNEKTTAAMNNLSNTVRFSDTTTKQDIQAQLKNTDATKLNASNTMQLAVGIAGIGNAFANGDWLGGILGLAQVGIGLGWFGKANGGAFATGGSMSNGIQAAGRIQGAGTGRSDSILAYLANKGKFVMLSNGEYVINEKSAKALGYDTLDNLNAYADGGALSSPVNPTPYVPTINQQVAKRAINIHSNNTTTEKLLREQNAHMLEQNNLLKNMGQSGGDGKMIILNTQASSADVLKALQENPRAVQAILGRQNRMGFR